MTKKALTKAQMQAKARKEMGKAMPDILFGTSDGHLFLEGARSLALDHARRHGVELFTLHKEAEIPAQSEPESDKPQAETPAQGEQTQSKPKKK